MAKIVSVIGQGFVGLPTSLLISQKNFLVEAFDKNKEIISQLNNGTFFLNNKIEDDIKKIYDKVVKNRKIHFSDKLKKADIYLICVPTPVSKKNTIDLSFVKNAIREIAKKIKKRDLIIIESTVSVGSTEKIKSYLDNLLKKTRSDIISNYYLAYCPERVLPGNTVHEILNNDRIVGGIDKKSSNRAQSFYKSFIKGPVHKTNSKIAEIIKLSENSYRDTNIAFANELSIICEQHDVNPNEVISLSNKHPRVNILKPGIGVGGHCIAVDPWFLIENYKRNISIVETARNINNMKTTYITNRILKKISSYHPKLGNILVLGLSYKENIGDLRESPSLKIINSMASKIKNKIYVHEPHVDMSKIKLNKNIQPTALNNGIKKSDLIIILVAHKAFKNIKKQLRRNHVLFDLCGLFND